MSDSDQQHERLHRLVLCVPLAWAAWVSTFSLLIITFDTAGQPFNHYLLRSLEKVLHILFYVVPLVFLLRRQRAARWWLLVLLGGVAFMILYFVLWIETSIKYTRWGDAWVWGFPPGHLMFATYVSLLALWQIRLSRAQAESE